MQGEQEETALCRGPWEAGVHLGPVEVKPEWGMPHGEGVQGLDQGTEEQLNQDPGAGTQAFQEPGKMQTGRKEGHRKWCFVPSPSPFPLQTQQLLNYVQGVILSFSGYFLDFSRREMK